MLTSTFRDPDCRAMLAAALALAATGPAVFPSIYCKKEPVTRRGFYDASTNPATVKRWFGGNFKRNLAVRTGLASGAVVLDVDDLDALTALEDRHGAIVGHTAIAVEPGRPFVVQNDWRSDPEQQ